MAGTVAARHAYCEDASDDSDTQTDTRMQQSAGGHANVAAKRSHPSDLNNDKPVEAAGPPDAASDSGYSSHTNQTMSSADSAQSAQNSPPTSAGSVGSGSHTLSPHRRRPTLDTSRTNSQSSPRKPLVRTASSARRGEREECTVPNCECKQSQRQRRTRPQPSPLDSALDINYPPFDQRSQRSDPSSNNYPPPSPQSARTRAPSYVQGSAIIQPASTARRRTSSTSRPRPVSYHSGVPSEAGGYWAGGMAYPAQGDRGPPPSMSAHFMPQPPQMQPFPPIGQTPPNGYPIYPPTYDPARPPLASRNSSQYSTRRPTSQYGAPLIYQEPYQNSTPTTRGPPPSARYDTQPFESSSSSGESETEEEAESRDDRRRMPPPPRPLKQRRPSDRERYADSLDRMTQSQTLPPRERERERERDREVRPRRPSSTAPSRVSSLRRPSLVQRDAPKSVSYSNSVGNAKVVVETAKSRRRQSYMGPGETAYELEARRSEPVYRGDTIVERSQPRRRTDADRRPRERDENGLDAKQREVEAYLKQRRGDNGVPVTEQLLKAQKRSSRIPSGGSEVGSHRSRNSQDRASRVSVAQTVVTNGGANGEVRLRLDGLTNINLEVSGGEQRTIRLAEAEDGTRELIIATPRDHEAVYRSERGSVTGRRPLIMSRRDAEEDSVQEMSQTRSRRSSRPPRPEPERRGTRRRYEE